jgi:hypothetical protein
MVAQPGRWTYPEAAGQAREERRYRAFGGALIARRNGGFGNAIERRSQGFVNHSAS